MTDTSLDQLLASVVDRIADAVAERLADQLPAPERQDELKDEPTMADRLKVSQQTLQRMRAAGVVPCVKLGRRVLYQPCEVLAALTTQKKGGDDA